MAYAVEQSSGLVRIFHTDGLGSVRAITNLDDRISVIETDQTDAFGIPTQTQGGVTQPFQFTGQQRDASTGLYYLRARMNDPTIGRFVTQDSVPGRPLSPQSLNRFSYAQDNPSTFVDPGGHEISSVLRNSGCFRRSPSDPDLYVLNPLCLPKQPQESGEVSADVGTDDLTVLVGPNGVFAVAPRRPVFTPPNAGKSIQANRENGLAFEAFLAALFEQAGYQVERGVRVTTGLGVWVLDLVISKRGKTLGAIEAKYGSSPYTSSQQAKDAYLRIVQRVTVTVLRSDIFMK